MKKTGDTHMTVRNVEGWGIPIHKGDMLENRGFHCGMGFLFWEKFISIKTDMEKKQPMVFMSMVNFYQG